jgi:hypothetical protein
MNHRWIGRWIIVIQDSSLGWVASYKIKIKMKMVGEYMNGYHRHFGSRPKPAPACVDSLENPKISPNSTLLKMPQSASNWKIITP